MHNQTVFNALAEFKASF